MSKVMKEYKFAVILCGRYTDGTIIVKANDEDYAYEKAMDYVSKRLCKAFPELGIDFNVECVEED